MILYSINYRSEFTSNTWSIVTIHKTRESAEQALNQYKNNCSSNKQDFPEYIIYEIDTDIDSDIIYDYENVDYI